MNLLARCCSGLRVSGDDEAKRSVRRPHALVGQLNGLPKNTLSYMISQACSVACARLPGNGCEQWSARITMALANVEQALHCTARLLIVSSDGLPWVFSHSESLAEDGDRVGLLQLADVLIQQVDDVTVVVRRSRAASRGVQKIVAWMAGQSLVMEPMDLLALPITPPGTDATAAVLLGWERPMDKTGQAPSKDVNTFVSAGDMKELHRLAQFLGYGLMGDPQHARYLARVCRHLALMPIAPSLHDLIFALLEGAQDVVLTKFALNLQPILAAVFCSVNLAVLFAQRQSALGSALRPCTSDAQAQVAVLDASSVSGAPACRAAATNPQGLLGADNSSYSILGSNGGAAADEGRVRATKISLPHTLLQQSTRALSQALQQPGSVGGDPPPNNSNGSHPWNALDANSRGADQQRTQASTCSAPPAPARPPGRWPLQISIVPNASSHVLEDQQPCRDLLVCGKLTSVKAGSIVLMVEPQGSAIAVTDVIDTPLTTAEHRARAPGLGTCMGGVGGGSDEAMGSVIQTGEGGRSAALPASPRATAGQSNASSQPSRPPPYQLALYLLSADVMPAGLLRLVAEELQAVLPIFFGAFRTALSAGPDTPGVSSPFHEWRRLQEQLLGQPLPPCDSIQGAEVPAALTVPHALSPALMLDAGMAASPQSPVALQRSANSSRLFRSHVAMSPVLGPSSVGNGPPNPASTLAPLPSTGGGSVGGGGGGAASAGGAACGQASPRAVSGQPRSVRSAVKGLALSHGGGVVRKGLLALLAAREEAGSMSPQHALSTPGMAEHAGGLTGSPGSFKTRMLDSPAAEGSEARAGSAASLSRRAFAGWPTATSLAQLTLEQVAAGPSALDVLINSMRQGLAAAGTHDNDDLAAQAQDLAAVQLLEVLGRGGQGVVFRGTLHGLETAVKVLTDSTGGPGLEDEEGSAGDGEVGQGPEAAGAGAAAGAAGGQDSCEVSGAGGKAREARIRQAKRGAMEVAVIRTLSHPSIVQVYATFSGVVVVRCQYHDSPRTEMRLCFPGDDMLGGKDPGPLNQVICLEYCDAGTLLAAARNGAFRQPLAVLANGAAFPALVPLYKSLLEVALALRYLHSRKLVHCDLKAANVLLMSSNRDPRGWTCKLSDFGCVRLLTETAGPGAPTEGAPMGFRTAAPVGTIAYMAPDSLLTPAVDVYSFGVLMWELLMCRTPYAGMHAKDVPRQVIRHNLRPSFHPLAPADYCTLAARCWSARPDKRPTAIELVGHLESLLADAQASAAKETQVAAAAAAAKAAAPHASRLTSGRTTVNSTGSLGP